MPTIEIIDGVRIRIYPGDHAPPHFHAILAEYEVQIAIDDLRVMNGSLPSKSLKAVLAWAEENMNVLRDEWERLNG
ncbi:MAG: DUF4160 domain-containing protein [Ahrensia sp.]